MIDAVNKVLPGLFIVPEKGGQKLNSVESFSKDKDISELLELLSHMKDCDGPA
mgnify:CR=1 FL=1